MARKGFKPSKGWRRPNIVHIQIPRLEKKSSAGTPNNKNGLTYSELDNQAKLQLQAFSRVDISALSEQELRETIAEFLDMFPDLKGRLDPSDTRRMKTMLTWARTDLLRRVPSAKPAKQRVSV